MKHAIAADPNAVVNVEASVQWDDTNGVQVVQFTETTGPTGVDVDYEIR